MRESWVGLALLCCFHPIFGGMLYPRESEHRNLKSLDGIWQFRAANSTQQGIEQKWFESPLADNGPTIPMPVPSSYNDITQDKDLREHVGSVWYERNFFVPFPWRQHKQRTWLRFGSAHYAARVWLNGKEVLQHEIGHLPFETEVTNFLKFGKENRITVEVDNTLTQTTIPQGSVKEIPTTNGPKQIQTYTFDFFNYAGIHRPVVLYTTPSAYIDDITIHTDVQGARGIVHFNVTVKGEPAAIEEVVCHVSLLDAKSKRVGLYGKIQKSGASFIGKIEVPKAQFWWPYLMDPNPGYLYSLEARIVEQKNVAHDIYRLPVGIRKISWNNTSLMINNVPMYLKGFGRHEDSDIRGKGLDLALVAKDYNLLKWIGANAYRTSHYPYAEEIMDFADREGIMIVDECPSVNAENYSDELLERHKHSLTQLIQRDKNRPSVIMWSVANEPRTQLQPATEYFGSVVKHAKSLDTSRPVTSAILRGCLEEHAGQFMDILGINRYNAWYTDPGKLEVIQPKLVDDLVLWHKTHNKPVMILEYGADTMPGLHLDPAYIWSEEYQRDYLSEHFKSFDTLRNKGFFVGEFLWNFADFKTDQTSNRVGGNMKGIFTRARQPKSSAYHLRKRYHQLAHQLSGQPLPDDLDSYTAPDVKTEL